jgi:hypothetical protein
MACNKGSFFFFAIKVGVLVTKTRFIKQIFYFQESLLFAIRGNIPIRKQYGQQGVYFGQFSQIKTKHDYKVPLRVNIQTELSLHTK